MDNREPLPKDLRRHRGMKYYPEPVWSYRIYNSTHSGCVDLTAMDDLQKKIDSILNGEWIPTYYLIFQMHLSNFLHLFYNENSRKLLKKVRRRLEVINILFINSRFSQPPINIFLQFIKICKCFKSFNRRVQPINPWLVTFIDSIFTPRFIRFIFAFTLFWKSLVNYSTNQRPATPTFRPIRSKTHWNRHPTLDFREHIENWRILESSRGDHCELYSWSQELLSEKKNISKIWMKRQNFRLWSFCGRSLSSPAPFLVKNFVGNQNCEQILTLSYNPRPLSGRSSPRPPI